MDLRLNRISRFLRSKIKNSIVTGEAILSAENSANPSGGQGSAPNPARQCPPGPLAGRKNPNPTLSLQPRFFGPLGFNLLDYRSLNKKSWLPPAHHPYMIIYITSKTNLPFPWGPRAPV